MFHKDIWSKWSVTLILNMKNVVGPHTFSYKVNKV